MYTNNFARIQTLRRFVYEHIIVYIQAQKHVYKQFMFVWEHRYVFQIIQPWENFVGVRIRELFVYKHNVVYIRAHLHVYEHVERLYTNTVIVCIRTEKKHVYEQNVVHSQNFPKIK